MLQYCSGPFSKYPLSDPNVTIIDEDLFGIWYSEEDTTDNYVVIGIDSTDRLMAHQFSQDKHGKIDDFSNINFFLSEIESGKYINIYDSKYKRYLIMKYEIFSKDTLNIWFLNEDKIKFDIINNKLKGVYKQDSLKILGKLLSLTKLVLNHQRKI